MTNDYYVSNKSDSCIENMFNNYLNDCLYNEGDNVVLYTWGEDEQTSGEFLNGKAQELTKTYLNTIDEKEEE